MNASLFHGNLVASNRILYTPSVFAKTNLIHLQEIGELQARQPHTSKRENLASFLFFIVLKGSGTLEYDRVSYPLNTGDCVFLDCKKAYCHRSSENLWTLKWVHFYGPNMKGIYEKYIGRGGCPYFHPNNLGTYEQLLIDLYEIANSTIFIRDMKIFEKLAGLLTLLMEESWSPESNPYGNKRKRNLQDVKEYLDEHYQEKVSLESLSELFYINKFYLSRIFKEQFGLTLNNYLLQMRITHAKQLLRFTNLPIEKIGQQCGMMDANYFSRMFKNLEGITPGEYRRSW